LAKALIITRGDGILVKKYKWQPRENAWSKSIVKPYMWASGSIATTLSPACRHSKWSIQYCTFDENALSGIITPFEKPVEPEV
jgi:hypothetical protein